MDLRKVTIIYGTQTGTAQEVAEEIGRKLEQIHFDPLIIPFDKYNYYNLPKEQLIIIICSTCGKGEFPDHVKRTWNFLRRKDLGSDSLSDVNTAVFGLGDSGYSRYNIAAKLLYKRLLSLGANMILRRGDGDDQHPNGLYGELIPWMEELESKLLQLYPLGPGLSKLESIPKEPRYTFIFEGTKEVSDLSRWPKTQVSSPPYNNLNPFYAKLVKNTRITHPDWEQDVRHIEFEIDPNITYSPGDVVYIKPRNNEKDVNAFLELMDIDGSQLIRDIVPNRDRTPRIDLSYPITVKELFVSYLDIIGSPRRYFFELLSHFAKNEEEKSKLLFLSSPQGQGDMYDYSKKAKRSSLDVLKDFSSARPSLEYLFDILPRLQARAFSISSAPTANTLSISMVVVQYKSNINRIKKGVCSNWLASLDPDEETYIPIWISKGTTSLPEDLSLPIVMVGPGTGCAIFRSFLGELMHRKSKGHQRIFFFGCRHREYDFLYKDEWSVYQEEGILSHFEVAFSRDQKQKVYVQHIMAKHSRLLWNVISSGGYIYVCGNANKMPDDIRQTILNIISTEAPMDIESAEKYLKQMEVKNRYCTETWF